jgi:hypothetical protein
VARQGDTDAFAPTLPDDEPCTFKEVAVMSCGAGRNVEMSS